MINVLSLFDGISVAFVSLGMAGIRVKNYYASEIDEYAIKISKKNYPAIIRLGDVKSVTKPPEPIDLLIGGSPCQDLSIAKKDRKGLDGDRSGLFYEYVRIKDLVKPKWFILENVASMSKADRDTISEIMGVQPVMFNASLVSAQTRKRLFWTNINFELPLDKGIILKDILEPDAVIDERMVNKNKKSYTLTSTYHKVSPSEAQIKNSIEKRQRTMVKIIKIGHVGKNDAQANRVYSVEGKSCTLSANGGGLGAKTGLYGVREIRKLTPIECERLQSLPDNYTEGVFATQRYKCLGNAFNAEVIAHILREIIN